MMTASSNTQPDNAGLPPPTPKSQPPPGMGGGGVRWGAPSAQESKPKPSFKGFFAEKEQQQADTAQKKTAQRQKAAVAAANQEASLTKSVMENYTRMRDAMSSAQQQQRDTPPAREEPPSVPVDGVSQTVRGAVPSGGGAPAPRQDRQLQPCLLYTSPSPRDS